MFVRVPSFGLWVRMLRQVRNQAATGVFVSVSPIPSPFYVVNAYSGACRWWWLVEWSGLADEAAVLLRAVSVDGGRRANAEGASRAIDAPPQFKRRRGPCVPACAWWRLDCEWCRGVFPRAPPRGRWWMLGPSVSGATVSCDMRRSWLQWVSCGRHAVGEVPGVVQRRGGSGDGCLFLPRTPTHSPPHPPSPVALVESAIAVTATTACSAKLLASA